MRPIAYVQVLAEKIVERRGNSTADGPNKGRPYHIGVQGIYVFTGGAFPEKFETTVDLGSGEVPYPPGFYLFGGGSFERIQPRRGSDNTNAGKLGLSRNLVLTPLADAVEFLATLRNERPGPKSVAA